MSASEALALNGGIFIFAAVVLAFLADIKRNGKVYGRFATTSFVVALGCWIASAWTSVLR